MVRVDRTEKSVMLNDEFCSSVNCLCPLEFHKESQQCARIRHKMLKSTSNRNFIQMVRAMLLQILLPYSDYMYLLSFI